MARLATIFIWRKIMGTHESEKFKRSVMFYVNGIDPEGAEIYKYWEFTNLIRAKIRSYTKSEERKVNRVKRQKKEILNLLEELEEVKTD